MVSPSLYVSIPERLSSAQDLMVLAHSLWLANERPRLHSLVSCPYVSDYAMKAAYQAFLVTRRAAGYQIDAPSSALAVFSSVSLSLGSLLKDLLGRPMTSHELDVVVRIDLMTSLRFHASSL